MNDRFPGAVPEVPVTDLNRALDYYKTRLGFTVDWNGGELGLAGISKGDCRIFLANKDYRNGYGNVGPTLTWLNLNSKQEVNELFEAWSTSGAKITSPPDSKPWGLHEFTAADLDGNLFRVFYDFGTSPS